MGHTYNNGMKHGKYNFRQKVYHFKHLSLEGLTYTKKETMKKWNLSYTTFKICIVLSNTQSQHFDVKQNWDYFLKKLI